MIRLTRGTAPLLSRGNSAILPRRRFAAGTPSSSLRPLLPSGGRRNAAHAASAVLVSVAGATYVRRAAQMEAPPAKESSLMDEFLERMFGTSAARDDEDAASSHSDDRDDESEDGDDGDDVAFTPGRGRPVKVPLDPELVASLPVVPLSRFQTSPSSCRSPDDPLLVTHDGIVYDVSSFAAHHPGGRDLLLTAGGLDLSHFFRNYAVHGRSDKAARWLAPLAVGKLSDDDRRRAERGTTAAVHVERRHRWLGRARRRIVLVAATLPLWMTVRTCVGWVGWWAPGLGRWLARWVPVAVPGLSAGAEPLAVGGSGTHADADKQGDKDTHADNHTDKQKDNHRDSRPTVAVIGGGIAGCGTAWALRRSGFKVTLYEAREEVSGNARTFEWDFSPFRPKAPREDQVVKSCVSVVAWPPLFYKNYMCLLKELNVETMDIPLSWFVNSKVPGAVGTLWAADPTPHEGSLRNVLKKDFDVYEKVVRFSDRVCNLFTMRWAPWRKHDTPSMYDSHQGIGLLNPLNVVPLYSLFRFLGGSDLWWQVVFTPHYTASFLVDELRPFPAVFGPLIEAQIPLLPNPANATSFSSRRSPNDCKLTTCQTWKHAGKGIRRVFDLLTADVDLRENTRVREVQILPDGKKRVHDEYDRHVDVDRVVFACPANAIGNIHKSAGWLANTIFSTFVYADDHHPDSGHMHPVMHSDGTVIDERYRKECLERASNYVEVTRKQDGTINIENQYNFGVQTAGFGVYDLPLEEKPVMLISHALGEGKEIDPKLVRGTANHARAHPLYSGWNVMAMLSLRLIQGKNGIYYCSNWTTPGNCHDMSFLSGLVCAHAIGAKYPFEDAEAEKDFHRLRDLMGF